MTPICVVAGVVIVSDIAANAAGFDAGAIVLARPKSSTLIVSSGQL
jgi:hypothetical protein